MKKIITCFLALPALAMANDEQQNTWIDRAHGKVSSTLDKTAHHLDDWFGEPDPNRPASANLRILLDTHWNADDGVTFKPRVRGRVRLPVLERKLSVVFGDDSLDEELGNSNHLDNGQTLREPDEKRFASKRSRDDNSSLALRWSDVSQALGVNGDADIGIRSGSDLYARVKLGKTWQHSANWHSRVEQMYRYGVKSEHYARSSYELKYAPNNQWFVANELWADYRHDDDVENWGWGDSVYRQHHFQGNKRLNYGVFVGGDIDNRQPEINTYGPFVGWRQPVWRDWLFVQTELNYYNNRKENRSHRAGGLLRVEALF
ncbi:hypothetical protein [Wielerella bovis]|uniref:hypothetical protein n=1 Tax=Wielerella bovis TaxID=2917790 RepID=UPI0020196765|nr:hypothetical protein [Wielerella bovis]ULJ60230.1 hypothetical protein MIS44_11385 [Wielerella bovis]